MHDDTRYTDINNGRPYPPLTREAAGRAARKLVQHFGSPKDAAIRTGLNAAGETCAVQVKRDVLRRKLRNWTDGHASSARRCWVSTKPTTGHDKGWGRLIHDVSHMIHSYRHPKARPHDGLHSQIERDVQVFVELSGWLTQPPESTKGRDSHAHRAARYVNVCERLKRWESKRKRAETAIRKLSRQKRRLESLHSTEGN